jgi:hypothetical protein
MLKTININTEKYDILMMYIPNFTDGRMLMEALHFGTTYFPIVGSLFSIHEINTGMSSGLHVTY